MHQSRSAMFRRALWATALWGTIGCEAAFPGGGTATPGGPTPGGQTPVGGSSGSVGVIPAGGTTGGSPVAREDAGATPASGTAPDARAVDTRVADVTNPDMRGADPSPDTRVPDTRPPEDASAEPPPPPAMACNQPHQRMRVVRTADELRGALSTAAPGDLIRLSDGQYAGAFVADRAGNATAAIVLCGGRGAILAGGTSKDTLTLRGVTHWILSGFSVEGGLRGVMLDRSNDNRLVGLSVRKTAQEGVHFRAFSSRNVLERSQIFDTGRVSAEFGEAVYIGSAESSWAKLTGGQPDRSDENQILDNVLGPDVRAEHIDVKEGTSRGRIEGNVFDGKGMVVGGFADSWVDVKGNGYTLRRNRGMTSLKDGFQVHVAVAGWGNDNVFTENVAAVNANGHGFWIQRGATGNQVHCNNQVTGAAQGMANVSCR